MNPHAEEQEDIRPGPPAHGPQRPARGEGVGCCSESFCGFLGFFVLLQGRGAGCGKGGYLACGDETFLSCDSWPFMPPLTTHALRGDCYSVCTGFVFLNKLKVL